MKKNQTNSDCLLDEKKNRANDLRELAQSYITDIDDVMQHVTKLVLFNRIGESVWGDLFNSVMDNSTIRKPFNAFLCNARKLKDKFEEAKRYANRGSKQFNSVIEELSWTTEDAKNELDSFLKILNKFNLQTDFIYGRADGTKDGIKPLTLNALDALTIIYNKAKEAITTTSPKGY